MVVSISSFKSASGIVIKIKKDAFWANVISTGAGCSKAKNWARFGPAVAVPGNQERFVDGLLLQAFDGVGFGVHGAGVAAVLGGDGQFGPLGLVDASSGRLVGPEPEAVLDDGRVAVHLPDERVGALGVRVFLVRFLEDSWVGHPCKVRPLYFYLY